MRIVSLQPKWLKHMVKFKKIAEQPCTKDVTRYLHIAIKGLTVCVAVNKELSKLYQNLLRNKMFCPADAQYSDVLLGEWEQELFNVGIRHKSKGNIIYYEQDSVV